MNQGQELDQEECQRLLAVARETIGHYLDNGTVMRHEADLDGLTGRTGAFVTLHKRGNLRGCIGNFTSEQFLVNTVEDMALAAATGDPRFPPLTSDELPECNLEISVLSPLQPIESVDEIEVGRHGIYIISPRGRGVLLPQVATEYGWDRETFLEHTCLKAGLNGGCWRDPDVQILIFSAQVFGEKEI